MEALVSPGPGVPAPVPAATRPGVSEPRAAWENALQTAQPRVTRDRARRSARREALARWPRRQQRKSLYTGPARGGWLRGLQGCPLPAAQRLLGGQSAGPSGAGVTCWLQKPAPLPGAAPDRWAPASSLGCPWPGAVPSFSTRLTKPSPLGPPAALPALPAGAALCPWGPPAGRVSASAGGEELQGDRAADPGHPLPPGRLRVSEQHRRLEPGLCRPHHHRLGFPQCCQDLQPDFPRKNSCLPLPSVSATGRPYPRSPRPSGVPAPPLREVVQRRQIGRLKSPGWGKVGSGPGFQTTATPHLSLARPCPAQPPTR